MGVSGSFPVDLILFGMIAAFLVLRLRGILGRRTGFERPPAAFQPPPGQAGGRPVIDVKPEPAGAAPLRATPDPASAVGQTLTAMKAIDRGFDPAGFLHGAEGAFRIIVAAFAAGDRARLLPLLSDDINAAFDQAIQEREKLGYSQVSEVRSIESATLEAAELRGSVARLTVRIVSDQISLTKDQKGNPVTGTEAVTEITDLWTFERDLAQPHPAWRLVSATSA